MSWTAIRPEGLQPPAAPYSMGALAGDLVITTGIVAVDAEGQTQGNDAAAQTRHIMGTIGRILSEAGCGFGDVVFCHVFLRDLADYAAFNAAYYPFFGNGPLPPRYCLQAGLVKPDWLVEVAAVARRKP